MSTTVPSYISALDATLNSLPDDLPQSSQGFDTTNFSQAWDSLADWHRIRPLAMAAIGAQPAFRQRPDATGRYRPIPVYLDPQMRREVVTTDAPMPHWIRVYQKEGERRFVDNLTGEFLERRLEPATDNQGRDGYVVHVFDLGVGGREQPQDIGYVSRRLVGPDGVVTQERSFFFTGSVALNASARWCQEYLHAKAQAWAQSEAGQAHLAKVREFQAGEQTRLAAERNAALEQAREEYRTRLAELKVLRDELAEMAAMVIEGNEARDQHNLDLASLEQDIAKAVAYLRDLAERGKALAGQVLQVRQPLTA